MNVDEEGRFNKATKACSFKGIPSFEVEVSVDKILRGSIESRPMYGLTVTRSYTPLAQFFICRV